MKKVLYFFPDNIGIQNSGNKTRAIHLLKYFKKKGFFVDFVSLKIEKEDAGSEQNTINYLSVNELADNTYLLQRKPKTGNIIWYFLKHKISDLLYYLITFPLRSNIPTFITVNLKKQFENILKNNTYDYIIISYVYYADLISDSKLVGNAKLIIDTHDFITAQFREKRNFHLGATFADEIYRLNAFHEIWAISIEERYIYSQFSRRSVRLITMMMDQPADALSATTNKKPFDLIYVASDNVHNIRAAKWFFLKVYPLLPNNINICVIGKINNYITGHINIHQFTYVPSLDHFYNHALVAICPMLSGTGIKVKVVEALSYGLPVVCSQYGADGLPNKIDNGCLVAPDALQFAILIKLLLENPYFYHEQSQLAKSFFKKSFQTDAVEHLLDDAFNTTKE